MRAVLRIWRSTAFRMLLKALSCFIFIANVCESQLSDGVTETQVPAQGHW